MADKVFLYYLTHPNVTRFDEFCTSPLVDEHLFCQVAVAPAVIITLLLAFTKTRRRLLLNVLQGRPGLIHPMDMTTKSKRMSFACAYCSTTYLIGRIVLDDFQLFKDDSSTFMNGFVRITSALGFGLIYLPVFASLTLDNAFSYGLAAAYTWMLTIVGFVGLGNCVVDALSRFILFLWKAPYLMSTLYLACNSCYCFYIALRKGEYFRYKPEKILAVTSIEHIKSTASGIHVRQLLSKPTLVRPNSGTIINFIKRNVYQWDPGFQYSARLIATCATGLVLLYQFAFFIIVTFLKSYFANYETTSPSLKEAIGGITIFSIVLALIVTIFSTLHHMASYRRDMRLMYRGRLKDETDSLIPTATLVGAMSYSGFQVIHVVLAFALNMIFVLVISYALFFLKDIYGQHISALFRATSPILLWWIITWMSQYLSARFAFLHGFGSVLALNNRYALFLFNYFVFFLNILLGSGIFVSRFFISLSITVFTLTRLDQSCLPRGYTFLDRAYRAYLGFVKLECSQTHPVMQVFLRLLLLSTQQRRELKSRQETEGEGGIIRDSGQIKDCMMERRRKALVVRWQLLYTLINNPNIRLERNGYNQKLGHAQNWGITIPKSDVLLDPVSLHQMVVELEEAGTLDSFHDSMQKKKDALVQIMSKVQSKIRGGRTRLEDEVETASGFSGEQNLRAGRAAGNRAIQNTANDINLEV